MHDLRLSMVQMDPVVGDIDGNLGKILSACRRADDAGSDIVCLPEMCLTGYGMPDSATHLLRDGDPVMDGILELTQDTGMCVCFGYGSCDRTIRHAVAENGRIVGRYDKTHLGEREKVMACGSELGVVRTSKAVIGLQLCWESHFPEISTTLAMKGADIILMPFASGLGGDRRRSSWLRYLPARAYDNTVYVGACNSFGDNGLGTVFGGGAMILDPRGSVLAEDFSGIELVTADLASEPLDRIRAEGYESMRDLYFLDKRRPELYFR